MKGEDRRRREKSFGYTLTFNSIYSGDDFWSGEIYLIGGNVLKNPSRYIRKFLPMECKTDSN